jgi:hypothetical protein
MATHLDPVWEGAVVERFRHSVTRHVRKRFATDFAPETQTAEDESLQRGVIEWFVNHSARFVHYVRHLDYFPDELSFIGDGHWRIDWEAIDARMWTVAYDCRRRLDAEADGRAFPTLDAWLAALHSQQLRSSAPFEPNATDFMGREGARDFAERARQRRRNWPRACRGCGTELSLERPTPAVLWCDRCWQERIPAG